MVRKGGPYRIFVRLPSRILLASSLRSMNKAQVAQVLDEIGTLLELHGENRFRSQAYHNAARGVWQLEGDLAQMVADGTLREVKGIGETLQEKITTLVTTGKLPQHEELLAKT